jgi:hypothetical protein
MKGKTGGIFIIIIGVVCILFSSYIKSRVNDAEAGFEKSKSLFSPFKSNPAAGSVGEMIEGKVEEKVAAYQRIAHWLMIGGVILVVAGFGYMAFCRKR